MFSFFLNTNWILSSKKFILCFSRFTIFICLFIFFKKLKYLKYSFFLNWQDNISKKIVNTNINQNEQNFKKFRQKSKKSNRLIFILWIITKNCLCDAFFMNGLKLKAFSLFKEVQMRYYLPYMYIEKILIKKIYFLL